MKELSKMATQLSGSQLSDYVKYKDGYLSKEIIHLTNIEQSLIREKTISSFQK